MVLPLLLVLVTGAPTGAELNERFARGVRLFEEDRVADALLEFEALEQLKPNPAVRFNLAHCHARLGHPVRAVALLEPLLAAEPKLPAKRLAEATGLLAAQRARIATVRLAADVGPLEGVLELDGVSRRFTLPAQLQLDPGPRNLAFQASGYFPARQVVLAGPGTAVDVVLSLVRAARPPARVRVRCELPAVELRVDGVLLATTPLLTPLLLEAGTRTLTASRAGYAALSRPLSLSEGVEELVELALEPAGSALQTLEVHPTEPQAVLRVDGALARADTPLRLPAGPHLVQVEREGFFPTRQVVQLEGPQQLAVVLEPTSQTLVELAQRRGTHRFWGFLGVGVGGALAIGGAAVWGGNQARLGALQTDVQRLKGLCQPVPDMPMGICPEAEYRTQSAYLTEAEWVRAGGLITLGVGVAAAGAGLTALLTAPDLSRYEPPPREGTLAPLSVSWSIGPGGAAVSGRF